MSGHKATLVSSLLVASFFVVGLLLYTFIRGSSPNFMFLPKHIGSPAADNVSSTSSTRATMGSQQIAPEAPSFSEDVIHAVSLPIYGFIDSPGQVYLHGAFVSEKTVDWEWDDSLGDNAVQIWCLKGYMQCVIAEARMTPVTDKYRTYQLPRPILYARFYPFTVDTWSDSAVLATDNDTPLPDCQADCQNTDYLLSINLVKKIARLTETSYWEGTSTNQFLLIGDVDDRFIEWPTEPIMGDYHTPSPGGQPVVGKPGE